jgi:hypothetical protein
VAANSPKYVDVPYTRTFPVPIDVAYAWLTDYRDDDHAIAGAIIQERRVVAREGNTITLEGHNELLGSTMRGRAIVRLFPDEHRWESDVANGAGKYTYQLTAEGPSSTRIEIHYRTRARRWTTRIKLTLARPLIHRQVAKMWDGFAEGMERDMKR